MTTKKTWPCMIFLKWYQHLILMLNGRYIKHILLKYIFNFFYLTINFKMLAGGPTLFYHCLCQSACFNFIFCKIVHMLCPFNFPYFSSRCFDLVFNKKNHKCKQMLYLSNCNNWLGELYGVRVQSCISNFVDILCICIPWQIQAKFMRKLYVLPIYQSIWKTNFFLKILKVMPHEDLKKIVKIMLLVD